MLSYYYYWQSLNRVAESFKTVNAMLPDVPPMIEAQHEMNTRELEYWREEAEKFTKILLSFIGVAVIMLVLYMKGMLHGF